jgi:hypothetical protein
MRNNLQNENPTVNSKQKTVNKHKLPRNPFSSVKLLFKLPLAPWLNYH